MSIRYHEQLKMFELRTERSSYLFGVNAKGGLQHVYWGEPVDAADCGPLLAVRGHSSFDAEVERETEEYGGWGGTGYAEPCLKARFADGVRDLKLAVAGHRIDSEAGALIVELRDAFYPLRVEAVYKPVEDHDLIERHAVVYNDGAEPIVVEQALAASWSIVRLPEYRLTHTTGRWAGEFQLRRTTLTEGKKVLDSRRGFTSPHANPWFAVDDGRADERSGRVWFGALAWSGNWKIALEKSVFGHVRVAGGINDFDGAFALEGGASYASPAFVGGFAPDGFGGMSRRLHRYARERVLPSAGRPRRVLYNSWEATEFHVTVEGQRGLAERAAAMGVELFVVDDGWFGQRNSDRAGLGDWYVNPEKFPNGLQELVDVVRSAGMDFGIWVEPESVNPDSDLYRAHPDWVYRFPNREGTTLRNQLLLNVGKPEVKAFILDFMTELLGSYDISFIKWDMNRTVSEPGDAPFDGQLGHAVWLKHVQNVYAIWEELRRRFPHVEFETCAGGGGRIDFGILRYADQAWLSDNTDAFDRLRIQEGYSFVYPTAAMMCWVTESPHGFNGRSLPLSYRFHSAMMGGVGIGANIRNWPEEQLSEAARYVAQYKEIRPLVLFGDLYRLSSLAGPDLDGRTQADANVHAAIYVGADRREAVAFAFTHAQNFGNDAYRRLSLQGLEADTLYEVALHETWEARETFRMRGSTLKQIGVPLTLRGDHGSLLVRLTAAE